MRVSTYRFNSPIAAVVIQNGAEPLVSELPRGSELVVPETEPDPQGMIVGTYKGKQVRVFQRDLDERAEPIGSSRVDNWIR